MSCSRISTLAGRAMATLLPFVGACGTSYGDPIYEGGNAVGSTDGGSSADAAVLQVVFQDDFTQTALDRTLWNTDWWWGRIKADDASYFADDDATFADGTVSLQISNTPSHGLEYTSGVLTTYQKFSFRFGRVELRAKVPRLGNLVVDLLAASTAWPPEIGVVASEMAPSDRVFFWNTPAPPSGAATTGDAASGTGVGSSDVGQRGSYFSGPDFRADFHVFQADWSPGLIVWSVDGVETFRTTTGVPAEDMYAVLAVELDPATVPATAPGPSDAEIDYFRIYQQK
jgi:beta-glucanase (GH16 family)